MTQTNISTNISNNLSAQLTLKKTWISTFHWGQLPKSRGLTKSSGSKGLLFFIGKENVSHYKKIVNEYALPLQKEDLLNNQRELIYFQSLQGPVWIIRKKAQMHSAMGSFSSESDYASCRDMFGSLVAHFKAHQLALLEWEIYAASDHQIRGALVGLELGAYHFRSQFESDLNFKLSVVVKTIKSKWQNSQSVKCEAEALAINSARHWVNLPPNALNPQSMSKVAQTWKWSPQMKLEVWGETQLKKENMNLLLAVGQGSETKSSFVHLKYRPKKKSKLKPIAFVGKGITYDTGGLDIKPSAGMRLMKKDMGGAATVLALAQWVNAVNYSRPCDFYLCLAENSVDSKSFRPSDLIKSRAGLIVEIDNTDAEGRLVLADGLDVAVKQKENPELIINVATLTGAIKVALGTEITGLFSNNDQLGQDLYKAGVSSGDYNWRMPLVDRYFNSLSSPFADFKNSADGFGGAITAALFLQKFVGKTTWAHLDIYAWADKASGALSSSGGNGQGVQCLIEFLKLKEIRN